MQDTKTLALLQIQRTRLQPGHRSHRYDANHAAGANVLHDCRYDGCSASAAPFFLRRRFPAASFSAAAGIDGTKWKFGAVSMVQGASRGIGLEFVKQLLEGDEAGHVIATCRSPPRSSGLLDLKHRFSERLSILPLDVTVESSIKATAESVGERYGYLNLLVNASGILSIPDILQPETTLKKVEKSSLMLAYEVNAVGPILVAKALLAT